MKWFLFSHEVTTKRAARKPDDAPIGVPEPSARPFFGAHLVDDRAPTKPACGDTTATIITGADEPRGFTLACCACLALSEIPHV